MTEETKKKGTISWWLEEIKNAREREGDFRKNARSALELYEAQQNTKAPYNILYSNTETMQAALYNVTPRPAVSRRYKTEDPAGLSASQVFNRTLEFFIDSGDQSNSSFDDLMISAILEGLVPGRGCTRFRYNATFRKVVGPDGQEVLDADGKAAEQVADESVGGEEIPWDRVLFGYAKRWSKVPWMSFEHFFSREEIVENFGEKFADKVQYNHIDDSKENEEDGSPPSDAKGARLAQVYEVWDKETKSVVFFSSSNKDEELKRVDDPLKLKGFFPIPRPLIFGRKVSSLIPVPLYYYYEEQARELNKITIRINKIVDAIKIRGMYNNAIEGLDKVLQAEDNVLIPADNVAAMADQPIEKAIWIVPIQDLIVVLQQLYQARESIKSTIFEIMGIADIMRGASRASETLGAQEIKNKWGSLRLRSLQKEVQRYVRDSLRIVAEIAGEHFSKETFEKMTELKFPMMQEKVLLQQQVQRGKQMAQAQAQQVPGQPPALPNPQIMQQIAMAEKILEIPAWEEVAPLLKDDISRSYRIDIETNSTIDAEYTEDKVMIGEFLNAVAQFLNGALPLVQGGILPFEVMKTILMTVSRRFRFGPELELELKKMQPPAPAQNEDPGKKEAMQKAQLELQVAQAEANTRMEDLKRESFLKEQEHAVKMQEMRRKEEFATAQHAAKMRQIALKVVEAETAAQQKKETTENASV